MDLKEFYYQLPEGLIATKPLEKRDLSKLLILKKDGSIEHRYFYHIYDFINKGELIILNNTKVVKSKISARKKTGGKIELLLFRDFTDNKIFCIARGSLKDRDRVYVNGIEIELNRVSEGMFEVNITADTYEYIINYFGTVPLPSYLKREADRDDEKTYQTVIAEKEGAVAAPTAALHFTKDLLNRLAVKGVIIKYVTLHVGPGTFLPVKTETVEAHRMMAEYFEISEDTANAINEAERDGRRIFYCGTTVVRAVETASNDNGYVSSMVGKTELYIYPGYKFKKVRNMITNFHLPGSTPLLLVSALAGKDNILKAYEAAQSNNYRFFSYGDAMLILND